jgi:hypothetical protein
MATMGFQMQVVCAEDYTCSSKHIIRISLNFISSLQRPRLIVYIINIETKIIRVYYIHKDEDYTYFSKLHLFITKTKIAYIICI